MKLKTIFTSLLFFCNIVLTNAQITIAIAKDKNHSVLDYKVEWGYGYSSESTVHAAKYLKLKGYTNKDIYEQTCLTECGHDITAGYYVVVKSTFKESYGLLKTGIGLGASDKSYDEATTRALKNLSINNWSWKKSDSYETIEKGPYDNAAKYQFVYIIWKKTTKDCGIQADNITRMLGKFDNALIGKLEKSIQTDAKNKNKPLPEVFHFEITTNKIGIIKESKFCSADKHYYNIYSIIQANTDDEINTSVKTSAYQSQASVKTVVEILTIDPINQSKYNPDEFLKNLEEILGKDAKLIKQIRLASIGIRG